MLPLIATVSTLERRPEFSDLLKEDHQYARGESGGVGESVNGWFDTLMIQSGIRTIPSIWLGLCVVSALTLGGLVFLLTERPILSSIAAAAGLLLPMLERQYPDSQCKEVNARRPMLESVC